MKKIRLKKPVYSQSGLSCHVTICSDRRIDIFNNEDFVETCAVKLKDLSQERGFKLIVYCFTPDHIHLLLNNHDGNSLIDLVRDLKYALTRLAWSERIEGTIFQKSFHDHFLRADEDLKEISNYIVQNPIRKGLSEARTQPPYVGSDVYDINQ